MSLTSRSRCLVNNNNIIRNGLLLYYCHHGTEAFQPTLHSTHTADNTRVYLTKRDIRIVRNENTTDFEHYCHNNVTKKILLALPFSPLKKKK